MGSWNLRARVGNNNSVEHEKKYTSIPAETLEREKMEHPIYKVRGGREDFKEMILQRDVVPSLKRSLLGSDNSSYNLTVAYSCRRGTPLGSSLQAHKSTGQESWVAHTISEIHCFPKSCDSRKISPPSLYIYIYIYVHNSLLYIDVESYLTCEVFST